MEAMPCALWEVRVALIALNVCIWITIDDSLVLWPASSAPVMVCYLQAMDRISEAVD